MRDIEFIREKVRTILREDDGENRERRVRAGNAPQSVKEIGRLAKEKPGEVLAQFGIPEKINGKASEVALMMARKMMSSPSNQADLVRTVSEVKPIAGGVEFDLRMYDSDGEMKSPVGSHALGTYIRTIYTAANNKWDYKWKIEVTHVPNEKAIVRVSSS